MLLDTDKVVKDVIVNSKAALGDLSGKTTYDLPFKLMSNHPVSAIVNGQALVIGKPVVSSSTVALVDTTTNTTSYIWPAVAYDNSSSTNFQVAINCCPL